MGGTQLQARGLWMGGTRLKSWGPAVLDGWHAAQELGARGFCMDGTQLWGSAEFGWVARRARGVWMAGTALGLGARGVWMGGTQFGWVERGFGGPRSLALELGAHGVWMGGTRLWGWVPTEFGAGGTRSLDGWHAAQEMGARGLDGWHVAGACGVWMGVWSWGLGARGIWMGGTWLMHWDLAPKVGDSSQPTPSISILSKHKHTQTHIHTYMLVPNRIGFVKCGER